LDYTMLGATGLKVSVAGLGCGGFSRLGLSNGKSEAEAAALVRTAVDLGVNFFDTAAAYGTEAVVGDGLKGVPRDRVVIATKASMRKDKEACSVADILASLDNSLRELKTDYIDVFQLHGVPVELYDYAKNEVAPALLREREKGKLRHIGVTETALNDIKTEMLQKAVRDDLWASFMLAFHMMHQIARRTVLPKTRTKRIGTLVMFAVRSIFVTPERAAKVIAELAAAGLVPKSLASSADPLGFLVHEHGASSLTDAAYRFARHEPGIDVVLFGTGEIEHMKANLASLTKPPLPEADRKRLAELFGHLVGVGLEGPGRPAKVERIAV
jgi:aryl-alcohol dehydrogenase-like predicted oxidoreductase